LDALFVAGLRLFIIANTGLAWGKKTMIMLRRCANIVINTGLFQGMGKGQKNLLNYMAMMKRCILRLAED